jgi:ribosomal-protein-alanine N-acetyltransferase
MNFEEQVKGLLKEFPFIETKRMTLTLIKPEDADAVFHLREEGNEGQYLGRHSPTNPGEANGIIQESEEGKSFGWIARLKNRKGDDIIGTCGFYNIDYENRKAEMGGEMESAHWGKYFAVEGTLALVSFGFNTLQFETIESIVAQDNESAIYLLEKIGFNMVKELKSQMTLGGKTKDLFVYTRNKGG